MSLISLKRMLIVLSVAMIFSRPCVADTSVKLVVDNTAWLSKKQNMPRKVTYEEELFCSTYSAKIPLLLTMSEPKDFTAKNPLCEFSEIPEKYVTIRVNKIDTTLNGDDHGNVILGVLGGEGQKSEIEISQNNSNAMVKIISCPSHKYADSSDAVNNFASLPCNEFKDFSKSILIFKVIINQNARVCIYQGDDCIQYSAGEIWIINGNIQMAAEDGADADGIKRNNAFYDDYPLSPFRVDDLKVCGEKWSKAMKSISCMRNSLIGGPPSKVDLSFKVNPGSYDPDDFIFQFKIGDEDDKPFEKLNGVFSASIDESDLKSDEITIKSVDKDGRCSVEAGDCPLTLPDGKSELKLPQIMAFDDAFLASSIESLMDLYSDKRYDEMLDSHFHSTIFRSQIEGASSLSELASNLDAVGNCDECRATIEHKRLRVYRDQSDEYAYVSFKWSAHQAKMSCPSGVGTLVMKKDEYLSNTKGFESWRIYEITGNADFLQTTKTAATLIHGIQDDYDYTCKDGIGSGYCIYNEPEEDRGDGTFSFYVEAYDSTCNRVGAGVSIKCEATSDSKGIAASYVEQTDSNGIAYFTFSPNHQIGKDGVEYLNHAKVTLDCDQDPHVKGVEKTSISVTVLTPKPPDPPGDNLR